MTPYLKRIYSKTKSISSKVTNLIVIFFKFGFVLFYGISTIVSYLMPNPFLYIKTVLFQTVQCSISMQLEWTWSDGNKGVLHIPQNSSFAGASPSDCLMSYTGHSLGESYPSAEMQSVYSTAPPSRLDHIPEVTLVPIPDHRQYLSFWFSMHFYSKVISNPFTLYIYNDPILSVMLALICEYYLFLNF